MNVVLRYYLYIVLLLTFSTQLYAQDPELKAFDKELSISSANDAFVVWQNSDRFYSFGIGLNLKFKTDKLFGLQNAFVEKTDYFFEIGIRLEGYTPTNKEVSDFEIEQDIVSFDRPFAGLLFSTFTVTYAFDRSFFKGGILLGVLGPLSFAEDFQGWFHENITNDPVFEEWKFQVPNQFVFNTNFKYGYDFLPQKKWFDVYGTLDTRIGNLYIDATPTLGFRIGKFQKLSESISVDNNILSNSSDIELFIQSTIGGTINVFDATAQGNLFNRGFEFAVDELNLFYATMTHGVYFASKRLSIGIEHYFVFGQVIPNERHVYARGILKYRF